MDTSALLRLLPSGTENKDEMAGRLRILLKHMLDKIESHEQILVRKGIKMDEQQQAKQLVEEKREEQLSKVMPEDIVRYTGAEPLQAMEGEAARESERQRLHGKNDKPQREGGESRPALSPDEEIQNARDAEAELKQRAFENAEERDARIEARAQGKEYVKKDKQEINGKEQPPEEPMTAEQAQELEEEQQAADEEEAEGESREMTEEEEQELEESKKAKAKDDKSGLFGRKSSKRK